MHLRKKRAIPYYISITWNYYGCCSRSSPTFNQSYTSSSTTTTSTAVFRTRCQVAEDSHIKLTSRQQQQQPEKWWDEVQCNTSSTDIRIALVDEMGKMCSRSSSNISFSCSSIQSRSRRISQCVSECNIIILQSILRTLYRLSYIAPSTDRYPQSIAGWWRRVVADGREKGDNIISLAAFRIW